MNILLKDHSACLFGEILPDGEFNSMEHSYSRDNRPEGTPQMGGTRTIMVHRPPQCPSCHIHTDEGIDIDEPYNPPLPTYNEENAKIAMEDSTKVSKYLKNTNSEEGDWEERLNRFGWTPAQVRLFEKITKILDSDRLARLTNVDKPHEPVHRRVIIDKSVDRIRKVYGNISWDAKLTQWIHNLLLDNLPPSYMAAYLDILQTMRAKVPTLVEKMLYARPGIVIPELMAPVLKDAWEPVVTHKNRKLPGQPFIVVVPSGPNVGKSNARIKKWYSLFATMASVVPIQSQVGGTILNKQSLQTVAEHMVAVTRAKMLEIRNEAPNRPIILVGFNAGASLALQVGLVENVSCIVCIGFAYNTVFGERGAPDDHILDVTTPIQFVVGQNAARSSPEEIENLRENMLAQTSLVVVGSADDCLRVCKTKRKIEGVTQTMVDNLVMDEIAEFATTCLLTPPEPKPVRTADTVPPPVTGAGNFVAKRSATGMPTAHIIRKRKMSTSDGETGYKNTKAVGRPRIRTTYPEKPMKKDKFLTTSKLGRPNDEDSSDASPAKSIKKEELSSSLQTILTSYEVPSRNKNLTKNDILNIQTGNAKSVTVTGNGKTPMMLPLMDKKGGGSSSVVLPGNQFIQLKPSTNSGTQKIYTLKTSPKTQLTTNTTTTNVTTTSGVVQRQTPNITANKPTTFKAVAGPTKMMGLVTSKTQVAQQQLQLQQQRVAKLQATNAVAGTFTPTKYTILKQSTPGVITPTTTSAADLSSANIFDMPIVFADNEGNIQDSINTSKGAPLLVTHQNPPKLITLQTPKTLTINSPQTAFPISAANRNIILNNASLLNSKNLVTTTMGGKTTTNKIIMINKSSIPQTSMIAKTLPGNLKLTKLFCAPQLGKTTFTTTTGNIVSLQNPVVANNNIIVTSSLATEMRKQQPTSSVVFRPATPASKNITLVSGNKVEILNSSIIKTGSLQTNNKAVVTKPTTIQQNTIIVKTAHPQFKQLPQQNAKPTTVVNRNAMNVRKMVVTTTAPQPPLPQIAPTKMFGSVHASQMVQKQLQQQQRPK